MTTRKVPFCRPRGCGDPYVVARTKDGFPPSPKAPFALDKRARGGMTKPSGNDADTQKPCPCLSPPRRRGSTRRDRTGFPPTPKAPLSTPLALRKHVRGY